MRQDKHDGQACLERARNGEQLSRSERLSAIAQLDTIGPCSTGEMADLFSVSARQIQYDTDELRGEYQRAAMELDILGEFYRAYRQQLAFIDRRLTTEGLEEAERISYLRERRALIFGFTDRITAVRLEHLLGEAQNQVSANGHTADASTAS